MRYLCLLLISTMTYAKVLKYENMKFNYRSYDGEQNYKCDHKLVNDLAHIWDLYCFDENNVIVKKFSANVWISRYQRSSAPENTYELIYRITERGDREVKNTGSSHWINLDKASALHSMTLSQSVENDFAGIYLDVRF